MQLKRKSAVLGCLVAFGLVLSACSQATPTVDPNEKITQVALTVQAELTRVVALTPSVTPTIPPTATATMEPATATATVPVATATNTQPAQPTQGPDNLSYVSDVTVPDGSYWPPKKEFTKTWQVRNSGTTTWKKDVYKLIYIDGTLLGPVREVALTKDVKPGEEIQISVEMVAPADPGDYISYWKMTNADGQIFGDVLTVKFTVSNASPAAPTPTP